MKLARIEPSRWKKVGLQDAPLLSCEKLSTDCNYDAMWDQSRAYEVFG